jgi:hypothetical protein
MPSCEGPYKSGLRIRVPDSASKSIRRLKSTGEESDKEQHRAAVTRVKNGGHNVIPYPTRRNKSKSELFFRNYRSFLVIQ